MHIRLNEISVEDFLFNGNAKNINVSLKFHIKVPTQRSKSTLCKNKICIANPKSFLNQRSDFALKLNSSKSLLSFWSFLYT